MNYLAVATFGLIAFVWNLVYLIQPPATYNIPWLFLIACVGGAAGFVVGCAVLIVGPDKLSD